MFRGATGRARRASPVVSSHEALTFVRRDLGTVSLKPLSRVCLFSSRRASYRLLFSPPFPSPVRAHEIVGTVWKKENCERYTQYPRVVVVVVIVAVAAVVVVIVAVVCRSSSSLLSQRLVLQFKRVARYSTEDGIQRRRPALEKAATRGIRT